MSSGKRDRRAGKIINWDWDWINSLSNENECPYYLTEREVGALLTFMDTMGWTTRWISPTEQTISKDFIEALRDGISDKLMRDEDCPSDPCEDGCIDYLPNSSFIRYEPNDPFRTPLLIPTGYSMPPWYTNPLIPLPGVIPTDAMVNQLAVFGPDLPASGFPRFSFEFDGRGEVEVELVNVPAGGFCLVVTDEDPLQIKIVNTSSNILDIISLAGILAALGFDAEDANVVDTDVVEIDIPDVGHHRIDVTFLPNFGGETFLGFGGGLRRVTFCGPMQVVEEMYLQRANPEDPCLIEQSTDGGVTWQEAWRMDNCCDDDVLYERYSPEGIKETSPDGETWTEDRESDPRFYPPALPPLVGEPGDVLRCEAANNVTGFLHSSANDIIAQAGIWSGVSFLLSAILGIILAVIVGASGGALTPLALALAGALLSTGAAGFDAAMTSGVYETFLCIVYCHTPNDGVYTESDWQATKAQILTDLTGIAATFLHDQINIMGIAGMNNASRTGISEGLDCDECECDDVWCYLFDFTVNDGSWTKETFFGDNNGVYQAASGWRFTDVVNTNTTPDSANRLVYIDRTFDISTLTKVTVIYDYVGGTYDSNARQALSIGLNAASAIAKTRAMMTDGTAQEFVWEGTAGGVTNVNVYLRASIDIASPYVYSGDAKIVSVKLEGTGTNPFGADNCP